MASAAEKYSDLSPSVEAYLLGCVDFHHCLALQRRLAAEIAVRDDGQIVLLLAEHNPLITIGRGGSLSDITAQKRLLQSRQIDICWVNRGGSTLVHCPGQLAVYPIVPLRWHGLRAGEYLRLLQTGLAKAIEELNIRAECRPGRYGLWGRTGQLAALGVAVRDWVTYYGAYVNVCPAMGMFRLVAGDPLEPAPMSCLVAERHGAARMATVRAAVVRHVVEALGCDRYHLYTGHPSLRNAPANAVGGLFS